ncbi:MULTISPECIES: hypothetical protein [Bacillus cereus group]|uniref:hypothetical protein n=1 Tax=Bacillus mycoides TaxID=1405 RepID=UPI000A27E596|nr:hypothetical protein [Bacillus mycoides]OSX87993.1 hypothetical protein BTJ44_03670 [Bacillus mycoides]
MSKKQMVAMTFIKPEHRNIQVVNVEENVEEIKEYAEQQGYHCKSAVNVLLLEKQYNQALSQNYKDFFEPSNK